MPEEKPTLSEEEIKQAVETFLARMKSDCCTVCGLPITQKVQIGCCVYREPCGHRLYHGTLTEQEKQQ